LKFMKSVPYALAAAAVVGLGALGLRSAGWLAAFGGRPDPERMRRSPLPVHWGTFNLAFHDWNEPPERALAAARKAGIAIATPRPGEFVDAARPQPPEPWWR
jgi:hypothetical protein